MTNARSTWLLVALGLALGCSKPAPSQDAPSGAVAAALPEVTVTQVASYLKDKSALVFDANNAETRRDQGIVPGAVLLSAHDSYPLSELPAQKTSKLVFYCGGTKCRASDTAAERAKSAGYSDVSVMREGIRGWKSAGMPTSAAPQS